jgi:hypothetical protein
MPKKEYIEREEAKKVLADDYAYAAAKLLDTVPTTDVQEVVRCKDCILRKTDDCAMYYRCNCGEQHTWENDNDFCSWGIKRSE